MATSSTAATQGGRLLSASICSFSMKMVSVRSQLWLRIVRSTSSELPTRLKSGWVFVDERRLLPVLELDLEHAHERALRGGVVRERVVRERPGVPLAPEAVHEGVDVLDERAAVELGREQRVQLAERLLEERVVVARLLVEGGLRGPASVRFHSPCEPDHRDPLEDEVRQRRRPRCPGQLIITRKPTRLPYCRAAANVAFQYSSGSRRPGRFCSSRQVGRR